MYSTDLETEDSCLFTDVCPRYKASLMTMKQRFIINAVSDDWTSMFLRWAVNNSSFHRAHSGEQCDQHSSSHKRVYVLCSQTGTGARYRKLHYGWMVKVENRITSVKADKPSLTAVWVAAGAGGEGTAWQLNTRGHASCMTGPMNVVVTADNAYTANQTRSAMQC